MSFLTLLDGTRIGYQRWGKGCTHKVLALHGWLDNSNSFSFLGPLLAENDFDVVAYDHVGHGHSSHIPQGMAMAFPKYVVHAKNIIDLLEWKRPTVLGHSMGAGVSTLLAGCMPDMINKLVLIEMLGPNNGAPEKAARILKRAIESEMKHFNKTKKPKMYDFQGAVDARIATVAKHPGKQTLSEEASLSLIKRFDTLLWGLSLITWTVLGEEEPYWNMSLTETLMSFLSPSQATGCGFVTIRDYYFRIMGI
jgi:pimeloyl-ACP methyl ester carboxylesterase